MSKIAIVGMACRFPGGVKSLSDYWELLVNGVDAIIDIPEDRWDIDHYYDPDPDAPGKMYIRQGGFLTENIYEFDYEFFGITPREATGMDPQQRLLLQVTQEALDDARTSEQSDINQRTGVFVGAFTMDNMGQQLSVFNREQIMSHTGVSTTMTMLSNRISHLYDFQGPSMTIDTACSSSLVALHLAVQALNNDECDTAIVGGVNLMFRPEFAIAMCKGRYLSPDARCKTFDKSANGYARGEGAGVVILKRANDLSDQAHVYATIEASGVNQDGQTSSISVPNGESQKTLIKEVCHRADIDPSSIDFVEAHGTGTAVGDPIEMNALGEVLREGRPADRSAYVSSVKTNIGHTEAAAGIASVIKVALCLTHRQLPPHLHLQNLNPEIDLDNLRLQIPLDNTELQSDSELVAAVNAFGYGGTNAHAILKEVPQDVSANITSSDKPLIVALTNRHESALQDMMAVHASFLETLPNSDFTDYSYTMTCLRDAQPHRAVFVASDRQKLQEQLKTMAQGSLSENVAVGVAQPRNAQQIAFVYSGMGTQSWGMAAQLMMESSVFRQAVEMVNDLFEPLAQWSILDAFSTQDQRPMRQPRYAQPANFALQVGLTQLWKSIGIQPASIVGHSVGEIAAAWVAGSLSLPEAVRLVYHRSRTQQQLVKQGSMLAIGLEIEHVSSYLEDYTGQLNIAAINSPQSVVVAGDTHAIEELAKRLESDDVFHRHLFVDVAYHSYQMESLKDDFYDALQDLQSQPPHTPLYSSVTGELWTEAQSVDYWWQNNVQPVRFQTAINNLLADGYTTFIELSPHPALTPHIRIITQEDNGLAVYSLHRQKAHYSRVLLSLAELYAGGLPIDWSFIYKSARRVSVPPYVWQREYLWTESRASLDDRTSHAIHPLLHLPLITPQQGYACDLSRPDLHYLSDHMLDKIPVLPASGYIEMMLALSHMQSNNQQITFENVSFEKILPLDNDTSATVTYNTHLHELNISSTKRGDYSQWTQHAHANILAKPYASPRQSLPTLETLQNSDMTHIDVNAFYKQLDRRNLNYGLAFRTIEHLARIEGGVLANLKLGEVASDDEAYYLHPTLLDGCLQSLLVLIDECSHSAIVPTKVGQLRWYTKAEDNIWCYGYIAADQPNVGTLVLFNNDGTIVAELVSIHFHILDSSRCTPEPDSWYYELDWLPTEVPDIQLNEPLNWLIISDSQFTFLEAIPNFETYREDKFTTLHTMDDAIHYLKQPDIHRPDGIIYCPSPHQSTIEDISTACKDMIRLVQTLHTANYDTLTRLAVMTIGNYLMVDEDQLDGFAQNGLVGLFRVIVNEHPSFNAMLIDLPHAPSNESIDSLARLLRTQTNEIEWLVRDLDTFVRRLVRVESSEVRHEEVNTQTSVALAIDNLGSFDNLYFAPSERVTPKLGELEVRVHSSAINFKDLMKVLNLLPQQYLQQTYFGSELGLECAGEVIRVGADVQDFEVGDQVVMTEGQGCFRSYTTVKPNFVVHKPDAFSYAESVVYINFITAYYALHYIAKLQAGERVVIHSATGGVGLAALQIAKWCGAEIFATAGSERKRNYLREMGIEFVSDARSLQFVDDILEWTDGHGVDVVLNTLSGDLLKGGLDILAPLGRFVELGKQDILQGKQLPMAIFDRNIMFASVDIDTLSLQRPHLIKQLMEEVTDMMSEGLVSPLPITSFPASQLQDAFRYMSQAQHIGKVVVDMYDEMITMQSQDHPNWTIQEDASYLITGGFSGFGLATAQWLATQGACHLALISRSGAKTQAERDTLDMIREQGVTIYEGLFDVTDGNQVKQFVANLQRDMPPLKGIIHGAMVLDDEFVATMRPEQFDRVIAPKVHGAWYLHEASLDCELDFFVLYSSITAIIGNPGQANYVAANAMLDGLARYRRTQGLPATSINWGSLRDVGIVARNQEIEQHFTNVGVNGLDPSLALDCLIRILSEDRVNVTILDMDWERWITNSMTGSTSMMYHQLIQHDFDKDGKAVDFLEQVNSLDEEQGIAWLESFLIQRISLITQIPLDRLTGDIQYNALGLDSLMTLEFNNVIRQETGLEFSTMFLLKGPSIRELANEIYDKLNLSQSEQS